MFSLRESKSLEQNMGLTKSQLQHQSSEWLIKSPLQDKTLKSHLSDQTTHNFEKTVKISKSPHIIKVYLNSSPAIYSHDPSAKIFWVSSCSMKNKILFQLDIKNNYRINQYPLAKAEILKWKMGMMGKYIQDKSEILHEIKMRSYSQNQ